MPNVSPSTGDAESRMQHAVQLVRRVASRAAVSVAGCVLLAALGVSGIAAVHVSAQTTSTTDVTIVITDEGTLDVHWGDGGVEFLTNGASPEVTASDSAQATAIFSLVVLDTRADGDRAGYSIAITTSGLGAEGEGLFVAPGALVVTDLSGLPEGANAASAIGSTLAAPVTVLSVAADAPAVDAVVSVSIGMTIPPGSVPGTYSGDFSVDVVAGAATSAP